MNNTPTPAGKDLHGPLPQIPQWYTDHSMIFEYPGNDTIGHAYRTGDAKEICEKHNQVVAQHAILRKENQQMRSALEELATEAGAMIQLDTENQTTWCSCCGQELGDGSLAHSAHCLAERILEHAHLLKP